MEAAVPIFCLAAYAVFCDSFVDFLGSIRWKRVFAFLATIFVAWLLSE